MNSQPLPSALPPLSKTANSPHFLSPRIYIPAHIYKHPAAILLELCSSEKELHQFIPLVIKNGLYNEHFFQTKFISLFCKFGRINEAVKVFERCDYKVDPLYHTLLKGHALYSTLEGAFSFFCRMKCDSVVPSVYNFTYLLKACADNLDVKRGKEIHGQLIVNGFGSNLFAMTSLVSLYVKCWLIGEAHEVFDRMPERDLLSWNMLITGYVQNGMSRRALDLIPLMQKDGLFPDTVTVVTVLPACADIRDLRIGKSFHGYVIRRKLESFVNVSTALVAMYAKCGLVKTARLIFSTMDSRTIVSWNAMIDGYAKTGDSTEALKLFKRMLDEGIEPNNITVMGALHVCADLGDLEHGQIIHKLANQLGFGSHVSVVNSLISMYCKCRRVDVAAELFKDLKGKTLVSWNTMILGYAQNGYIIEATRLFCQMELKNIKPDSFTLVSIITALAEFSILHQARWIHGLTIRTCFNKNVFVMTALIDMYSKCGAVHTARMLFDDMDERHVTTWNAMIDGYGMNGFGKEAVELFDAMRKGRITPNEVTFLCIISSCSHSGIVEKGSYYFSIMKEEYGIEPAMDHYGAMVDLLGRAGRLNEAWAFIENMPIEPGINVFGAILGACKIHKNITLAEKAADKLLKLKPEDGGYHLLLVNIYTAASRWDKVAKVRTIMEKTGIKKTPGCSLVDVKNEIHTFYSGSTNHPESKKLYAYLELLIGKIKAIGYKPETNAIHEVEDEMQEQLLYTHSEKLAIAFGLLNTKPGKAIHIRKNLRVCRDCHNATKYISLITERQIIVRDMHRFHHFKNGVCSCEDYW